MIDKLAKFAAPLILFSSLASVDPAEAQSVSIPSTVTHLIISNKTSRRIRMGVVLPPSGQDDGCTTNVSDLQIMQLPTGSGQSISQFGPATNGTFTLSGKTSYELISTKQNPQTSNYENCLQGVIITFGQFNQCPTKPTTTNTPTAWPPGNLFSPGPKMINGVCAAECTLNLPGTINGGSTTGAAVNEACDITCVNGANAYIELSVNSPAAATGSTQSALPWMYDSCGNVGVGQSFKTRNSWVKVARNNGAASCDDNCAFTGTSVDRPGVQPYGCSQCNIIPDPAPPCANLSIVDQFCAAQNNLPANSGCSFNRSPQTANSITQQFGGSVHVNYLGPAHPPAACP